MPIMKAEQKNIGSQKHVHSITCIIISIGFVKMEHANVGSSLEFQANASNIL